MIAFTDRVVSHTVFEVLTVHADKVRAVLETREKRTPVGTQWRLTHTLPEIPVDNPQVELALSVAFKLLSRGRVTVLPEALEATLDRNPTPGTGFPGPRPDTDFDSDEERLFWTDILPRYLGPLGHLWCTPQVAIGHLVDDETLHATEQRVDFVIAHPTLAKPLVVEIDGSQHARQTVQDAARDHFLVNAGYQVIRIPTSEVRAGRGPDLDRLVRQLEPLKRAEHFAGWLATPIRRAGQIQLALVHAMLEGAVGYHNLAVASDLVDTEELTRDEFAAIVTDLGELLQHVGRLYGADRVGDGIQAAMGADANLVLCFFDHHDSRPTLQIDDIYLPTRQGVPIHPVKSGLPVAFDEDLIKYFLQRIFRKPAFREGQYDILRRALEGLDTIGLLATGGGKSIAFQLAGLLLPGCTMVVAPLVSLIRDQVTNLTLQGLDRSIGITGDVSGRLEREAIYAAVQSGQMLFCYVAPERFQIPEFRERLRAMLSMTPVNLIVVDEAHCVSEWGHDFRTSYLRLGQTARICCSSEGKCPPLMALTGTASEMVLVDLQRELDVTAPDAVVTPRTFDRPELRFDVRREPSNRKFQALADFLIGRYPAVVHSPDNASGSGGRRQVSGLVFCPHINGRYGVTEIADRLQKIGVDAAYYSGRKPKVFGGTERDWGKRKQEIELDFKHDVRAVLATTKAFGMGVDKPNVRFTAHFGIPASIEAFYQEAGRAGRDRQPADCILIVSDDQPDENRHILAPDTPVEEVAEFINGGQGGFGDDVSRALYFHASSFKGVETEVDMVARLLAKLAPTGRGGRRVVNCHQFLDDGSADADLKVVEKALHRLVVIGVVEDYTVEHSSSSFHVELAVADRNRVIDSYLEYVAGYQHGRAAQERIRVTELGDGWEDFLVGVIRRYTTFVYEVIERGRRRAIAEMLAACEARSEEEFRRRILAYLENGEFSDQISEFLDCADSGLPRLEELFLQHLDPAIAGRLRGPVARTLESYPDHPGLLLLRSVVEAMAGGGRAATVVANFEAFLGHATEDYGIRETVIAGAIGAVMRVIERVDHELVSRLEARILSKFRERDTLRELIAHWSPDRSATSRWVLLEQTAREIDSIVAPKQPREGADD